jgi:hypothetical protein
MKVRVFDRQCFRWLPDGFGNAGAILATILLAIFTLLSSHCASAQTLYGSVVGTVTDLSGAVVPQASVTATNVATSEARTATSNQSGDYSLSTLPAGNYVVRIAKSGFRTFEAKGVNVVINTTARVDAALGVGTESQTVTVNADTAELETDNIDVHGLVSSEELAELPQPTRTYEGLIGLLPGVTPPTAFWAGGGGTNNPDKSMTIAVNGTSVSGTAVTVDGVSALNPWVQFFSSAVPSTEAIETVNVVTASSGADQGVANGAGIRVQIKSGTNSFHGSSYWYNIINPLQAKPYFTPSSVNNPKYIDNNAGGTIGGPIKKNKLFFFVSYEGDFLRQASGSLYTLPTPNMAKGILASPTPVYDPTTGNADGSGRTLLPQDANGNYIINPLRFASASSTLVSLLPSGVTEGLFANNIYINTPVTNTLQKIDSKGDWDASTKLRLSGRYTYHPYNVQQAPAFGNILGASYNTNQHGDIYQAEGMATYVASPKLVIDGLFGFTHMTQYLFPPLYNTLYGAQTLKIPGTNLGPLPNSGGVPEFRFSGGLNQFGYGYPSLTYEDPIFDYAGNVTWVKGNHSFRFGIDVAQQHMNHQEVSPTYFTFSGGVTSLYCPSTTSPGCVNGSPAVGEFNSWAQFLLGLPDTSANSELTVPMVTMRAWQYAPYVADTWQLNRKTTVYLGAGWNYFPVPQRVGRGIEYYEPTTNNLEFCGQGKVTNNCGISVQKDLFAPRGGVAYRLTPNTVLRAGYSLAPEQISMARDGLYNYPITLTQTLTPTNSYTSTTTFTQGLPTITVPDISSGILQLPTDISVSTPPKNFIRGYTESYNFTVQRELGWGLLAQGAYVGTLTVHQHTRAPINYGQVGGGEASQPLYQAWGNGTDIVQVLPQEHMNYKSFQAQLQKRFNGGLQFTAAYTWSQWMGVCCDERGDGAPQIEIPQYFNLNWSLMPDDRTNNFELSGVYELPFGKEKKMATSGPAAAILGGWQANWVLSLYSGAPFSVTDPGTSLNAPNNSQMANKVKTSVAIYGPHGTASPYFDTSAFAPVTNAAFGNAGWDSLRGPGYGNLDFSIFRGFQVMEKLKAQFRAEALNLTNHPNFSNPDSGDTDGSFGLISSTNPGSRVIAQRYLRLGLRLSF